MRKYENVIVTKMQCAEKDIFISDVCDVFDFNQAIILCNFDAENGGVIN